MPHINHLFPQHLNSLLTCLIILKKRVLFKFFFKLKKHKEMLSFFYAHFYGAQEKVIIDISLKIQAKLLNHL